MSLVTLWIILICGGVLTFAIRLSFIRLFGKQDMPLLLQSILRFVPITVLSAIIVPELFLHGNMFDFSLHNARWIAGGIAILVAWRTRNVLLTIVIGMVALWILQLLIR